MSFNLLAQLQSENWTLESIYTVDSVGDTMYASTIDTVEGELQPVFPEPFRVGRTYFAYLVWFDTLEVTVTDSIGVMIPAVNVMQLDFEMEIP